MNLNAPPTTTELYTMKCAKEAELTRYLYLAEDTELSLKEIKADINDIKNEINRRMRDE